MSKISTEIKRIMRNIMNSFANKLQKLGKINSLKNVDYSLKEKVANLISPSLII